MTPSLKLFAYLVRAGVPSVISGPAAYVDDDSHACINGVQGRLVDEPRLVGRLNACVRWQLSTVL
jgi:hypothetical protein